VLLALLVAVVQAKPQGASIHRPDSDCVLCHTAGRAVLQANPTAARTALVPDIDVRCTACHDDVGPSHPTGMAPRKPVPAMLPLSDDGRITCATCHFVHGEQNPYGDFLRIDNSRGALCLTCHQLAELE
jgi:predicted CXXCH cytochrome family protein